MNLKELITQVEQSRNDFIAAASGLTFHQVCFKPSPDSWSITDNVEHMVWAEQGGINGIWKAAEGIKNNKPVWTGELVNKGLSIEQVIERTWQAQEKVPESAKPRWGGPIKYWIAALENCRLLLQALTIELEGFDLEHVIYPHVISGPLNAYQRMEFLRFHLQRHQRQIEKIKVHPDFPIGKP
jgi:hypothetical protein